MVKKSELRQDINWQKVEDFDPKPLVPHFYLVGEPEEDVITATFRDQNYLDDRYKVVGAARKVIRELRSAADKLERDIRWVNGESLYDKK